MSKILFKFTLMFAALVTAVSLTSCSDDKEEQHQPAVSIGQTSTNTSTADINYSVTDAEQTVYKIVEDGEAVPSTAEALFADAEAKSLSITSTTLSVSGLTPSTKYTFVAAAKYGKFVSQLATATFTTTYDTETATFKSAVGSFISRDETSNTAVYIIDFSTNAYGDETTMPLQHLYVTLLGKYDAVDLKNLAIPVGTYTIGDINNPENGKFYPGLMNENGEAANTFMGMLATASDPMIVDLVKDGTITITAGESGQYSADINFIYEDGTHLEASYTGSLVVDNNSGEIAPAEVLDLPESNLTSDVTVTFGDKKYGSITDYGTARFGITNKTEYFLSLYTDDSYADCVDIYLLVDNEKYPGSKVIPVGKYPVITSIDWDNISSHELCAEPAWRAKSASGARTDLGTWYTWEYAYKAPLVSGEVEVVETSADLSNVRIKFTLKDAKGNTVSGEYAGKLE